MPDHLDSIHHTIMLTDMGTTVNAAETAATEAETGKTVAPLGTQPTGELPLVLMLEN